MRFIQQIIVLGLLAVLTEGTAIVQVESGRQLIHVDGREPFFGIYTRLTFSKLRCISSLTVDCITSLTGAEEIELIYKICKNDALWYLAHYSNTKGNFSLDWPTYATVLAVITHEPIRIIDVDVRPCILTDRESVTLRKMRERCVELDNRITHRHRNHHKKQSLLLEQHRRIKRSMDFFSGSVQEFTPQKSPYHILKSIFVRADQVLRIHAGTRIAFAENTGIVVHGILQITGSKYEPVLLYALNTTWHGLLLTFSNATVADQSELIYLNISGSNLGIRVESHLLPKMEHIISDSNGNGLTILAYNSNAHSNGTSLNCTLKKIVTVNNRENGISIRTGPIGLGHLILDGVVSGSNQAYGLLLEGAVHTTILNSQFFSNTKDGIFAYLTNGSTLELHSSFIGSNGQHGFRIADAQQIRVKLLANSFTGHSSGEAMLVEHANRSDFLIDGCRWWDNNGGVFALHQISDSDLYLLNGNWTRNRGTIVLADKIARKTNILIENNDFQQNRFRNNTAVNSVIELGMNENDNDVRIRLHGNRLFRNAMEIVFQIGRTESKSTPTNAKIAVIANTFQDNLALDTVYFAANRANISYNSFENPEARCELRSGLKVSRMPINASNNYWGMGIQEEIMDRICDTHMDGSLIPVVVAPFLSTAPEKSAKQLGSVFSKKFDASLIIGKGETAVFHEGSVLTFKPGQGIIVSGALHLLAERDNPILIQSSGGAPWLGIIVNPGGILYVNHCILEYASVGLNVSSPKISTENTQIVRPQSAGVLITTVYNGTLDLGHSIILHSRRDGIRIQKREEFGSIAIRNALLKDCAEAGIDFEGPAGNITIQNIVFENSGSYAIRISQNKESDQMDSIVLSNLTIRKQERGSGGILLNLNSYQSLHLNTSNFISNVLPSVAIFSKCQWSAEKQKLPEMLIEKNRFLNNDNSVMRLILEGCANAKIRRNTFIKNNEAGRNGVMAIQILPQVQYGIKVEVAENTFIENKGEWSMYVAATNTNHPFDGIVRKNRFSGNQHTRGSLIVGSPHFHVNDNEFDNKMEKFDLEIEYAHNEALDATGNYWGNDDIHVVEKRILDGKWDQLRGIAKINPISRKRAVEDCSALANCSHNGRCVGLNECLCDNGYAGADCAQVSCSELKNCSMNGYCIAPNVCKCFDGWYLQDCSQPTCKLVNNCTGHGTCVSLNECECDSMFEGADCNTPVTNCSYTGCNAHGSCVDGECVCETGWTNPFCSTAVCDQLNKCSGSGFCVRPQMCECFRGFAGDDCSICEGPTCDHCDAKCIHGRCNPRTKTCICRGGWTGPNCDICATGKCDVLSVVLYVLPTAAGIHQKNEDILVYGNDLPFAPSKRYTCLYGSTASEGFYISSSLVRCKIPDMALPGRYLFNIIPYGSDKAVPFLDKRLIHFTLFNECNPADCKGYCVGAICVCQADRDGLLCEQTKILPKIDREILENEKLTKAVEGRPYSVKMPTPQEKTIFNVHTDADGMMMYPNGMLYWAQPIGREQPYTVNVSAASLTGESVISWNLTVKATYSPMVTKVESIDDTNMKMIKGIVNYGTGNSNGEVPIQILIYQNDNLIENSTVTSTADGRFEFRYYPPDEATSASAIAVHPGTTELGTTIASSSNNVTWRYRIFDVEFDPVIKMQPGEHIDTEYRLRNDDTEALLNCQLELIAPRDKIQIVKYEKVMKALATSESAPVKVTFAADNTLDDTTVILQFKCIDTARKLIRQQIQTSRKAANFLSYPSELLISISPHTLPKIVMVDIVNEGVYHFRTTPRISIRPDNGPLFLVSTKPSLENFSEFAGQDSTLTLFLSYRPLIGTTNLTTAGDIALFDDYEQLFTVPYRAVHIATELLDFHVAVRDELSSQDPTHVVDDAHIILRNDVLGYDDRRQTSAHEPIVFFSIVEGIYQLTVTSPTHQTVTMIVQPSYVNSSLAVFAPLAQPYIPVIEDENLLLEEVDEQRKLFLPELEFTPSIVPVPRNGTEEMNLLVTANPDGPSDVVAVVPSVEIRDPQNLPLTIATPELRNALGPGDGYRMQYKLSRVSPTEAQDAESTCTVFILQIPYIYAVPTLMSNNARNAWLLADNRNEPDDEVRLCEVGLQSAVREMSVWTKSTIYCNCASKAKQRCRQQYVSAAHCGTAWNYIPDDTVSLHTVAMFIVLISDCRAVGVDFRKLRQSLACASTLDSRCPASRRRRATESNFSRERSRQRAQFFDQLALVSEQADGVLQKYFPVLSVLESQTANSAALYSAFFDQLNVVLPFKYFDEITNRQWFDKFFESISDSSEDGLGISWNEFKKLKGNKDGADLARYWNATVAEWSTTASPFSEAKLSGIKFPDARELIIRSDRLKTLTRQYGAENPFTQLHDYMAQLLSWPTENMSVSHQTPKPGNDNEDICAYAYTLITPPRPYENNDFLVTLKVTNKNNKPLESVKVTLEMIRSRVDATPMQFRIGPHVLAGIGQIDGASKLPPNASFTARWNLKPISGPRLTSEANYRAILMLKFTRNGRKNVQQIATQMVTFRPRPSLKIYYFIYKLIPSKNMENVNTTSMPMFTVMVAFMNAGYSLLKNVQIEETRLSVVSIDAPKNFIPYQIDGINIDGNNRVSSDLRIKIGTIESGKAVHALYNISAGIGQDGQLRDFKVTASMDGELIPLEDTRTFAIQQFISPSKFLVLFESNPGSLFYYDMQETTMRTVAPLVFVDINEKSGVSDGKPFRRQIASFRLAEGQQQPTSLYGRLPYPVDLEQDFEVLRVNQVGKDGTLKLVNPQLVWSSNTSKEFVHFIDENPPLATESIVYEVIYGNAEHFLRPHFEFPVYNVPLVTDSWPRTGDEIARITASSPSHSTIRYELYVNSGSGADYFGINPKTGAVALKKEIPPAETETSYCMTVRATDDQGRSETIAVAVDSGDFVKECRKIDNFDGLQPLIYVAPKSRPASTSTGTSTVTRGTTVDTSEVPKNYFLARPSVTTGGADKTESSEPNGFWVTPPSAAIGENEKYTRQSTVTIGENEYTRLTATQSGSGPDSSLSFGSSGTSGSDSETNPDTGTVFSSAVSTTSNTEGKTEGETEWTFYGSGSYSTGTADTTEGSSSDLYVTESSEEGTATESSSTEVSQSGSAETTGAGGSWDARYSSESDERGINEGRTSGSWYNSTSTRFGEYSGTNDSVGTSTTESVSDAMSESSSRMSSAASATGTANETVSTVSSTTSKTFGIPGIPGSFEIRLTENTSTENLSKTTVTSEGVPERSDTFLTYLPFGEVRIPAVAVVPSRTSPTDAGHTQPTSLTYYTGISNSSYFHLPSSSLETEFSSTEGTKKPVVVDNTNLVTESTSTTSRATGSFVPDGEDEGTLNLRPVPEIPVSPTRHRGIYVDIGNKDDFLEKACRLKETKPIWSLICDLSKTARLRRIAR